MSVSGAPSRLRLTLVVLAIFSAGLASGYALRSQLRPSFPTRGGQPPWVRDLDLTEEQRKLAEGIFARHRADVDVLIRDSFPKVRARNEQMEQELKAILTEEQGKKLDEIRSRRRAQHEQRGGEMPQAGDLPPPPPGFDGPPGTPPPAPPP